MKYGFITLLLLASQLVKAQSGNLDLMAGHEYLHYQHSVVYVFKNNSGVGWQHLAALIKRYEADEKYPTLKDELMNQVYLTARLSNSFTIKGGLFYTNVGGFKPSVSVQYSIVKSNWLMIVSPRADVVKNGAFEMFLAAEYKPAISSNLRLYTRLQAMTSITRIQHNRSYQLIRLGVEFKKLQFGAGLTLDEYGKKKNAHYNSGLFVRKMF